MDTSKWGKPGWKLVHSIALCCDNMDDKEYQQSKKYIKRFYTSIKHLLPCIYCRRSYTSYIKELPIDPFIDKQQIFKWTYLIHNKVNSKLRSQGYSIETDPSLSDAYKVYQNVSKNKIYGWTFFYCIAFNYPMKKCELSEQRYNGHLTFFTSLEKILCAPAREKYSSFFLKKPIEKALLTRESFCKWVHSLEKKMCNRKSCYKAKSKRIESYRVDKCAGKTCRKSVKH
jgi:hypothetical protein